MIPNFWKISNVEKDVWKVTTVVSIVVVIVLYWLYYWKLTEYNGIVLTMKPEKTAVRHSTRKYSHNCTSWVEDTLEKNLEFIGNYPRGVADKYMYKITGNVTKPKNILTSFPVIVTAANEHYYMASQGLIKSIRENLPKGKDIKIIYYDLGLKKEQRYQLTKHCNCEVRDFNFDDFPAHLKALKNYAWKPVLIKMVLMEYDWIWWCDSSVRFIGGDPTEALQYSRNNSVYFIAFHIPYPTSQLTNVLTFKYLGEDICKYRYLGQLEANFLLFHYDHVTDIVVDQWASCALNEACIAPPGSKLGCNLSQKVDGQCHRYDQSVLSIILRRLFHEEKPYPLVDSHSVQRYNNNSLYALHRKQAVHYFPP